jgi:hypothetical protein
MPGGTPGPAIGGAGFIGPGIGFCHENPGPAANTTSRAIAPTIVVKVLNLIMAIFSPPETAFRNNITVKSNMSNYFLIIYWILFAHGPLYQGFGGVFTILLLLQHVILF